MTAMLASIANPDEAMVALNAGVDIIDIKDPSQGVLGAVDTKIATEIVKQVNGYCPISATIGDLPMRADSVSQGIASVVASGVDIVKVGVFNDSVSDELLNIFQQYDNINIVLVFFADRQPQWDNLSSFYQAGVRGVMLDTAAKTDVSLRTVMPQSRLADFIATTRAAGLINGLAGSLSISDIVPLLRLQPDYLGFRGALCRGNERQQVIDAWAVQQLRQAIPKNDHNISKLRGRKNGKMA